MTETTMSVQDLIDECRDELDYILDQVGKTRDFLAQCKPGVRIFMQIAGGCNWHDATYASHDYKSLTTKDNDKEWKVSLLDIANIELLSAEAATKIDTFRKENQKKA